MENLQIQPLLKLSAFGNSHPDPHFPPTNFAFVLVSLEKLVKISVQARNVGNINLF